MSGPTVPGPSSAPPRSRTRMPAWMARVLARHGQLRGRYDAITAARFEQAWQRSRRFSDLVAWLAFLRELGWTADALQAGTLRGALDGRRGALAVRGIELLHAAGGRALAAGAAHDWLVPHAETSPPIAHLLARRNAGLSPRARRLAGLHAAQAAWRSELAAVLAGAEPVCVVGNAGSLNGAGLGGRIDAHRQVVRFNQWRGPASSPRDLGARLDVWVCAPRFLAGLEGLPDELPRWVVLSGPDARYRRAGRPVEWDLVLGMLDAGVKVLTVPLDDWQRLVGAVRAPPSAGLLFLAWAARTLGGLDRLVVAGFDIASARTKGYHHAGRGLHGGRRHAWEREKTLLDAWLAAGLQRLSGGEPRN